MAEGDHGLRVQVPLGALCEDRRQAVLAETLHLVFQCCQVGACAEPLELKLLCQVQILQTQFGCQLVKELGWEREHISPEPVPDLAIDPLGSFE